MLRAGRVDPGTRPALRPRVGLKLSFFWLGSSLGFALGLTRVDPGDYMIAIREFFYTINFFYDQRISSVLHYATLDLLNMSEIIDLENTSLGKRKALHSELFTHREVRCLNCS